MSKSKIHPRNKYQGKYDINALVKACPELKSFITKNISGEETIDFTQPQAVLLLNKGLLMTQYGLESYDLPEDNLIPPIPGRADYIHYTADLISSRSFGKIPTGPEVKVLDIGCGANCIYPIIGHIEYGWTFVGSDIRQVSLKTAEEICKGNGELLLNIEFRNQRQARNIFDGVIMKGEKFDLSVCNPPFFSSPQDSAKSSTRKVKNLHGDKSDSVPKQNFSGISNELWCEGGEKRFVQNMIYESAKVKDNVIWFTTLVSKESNLKLFYALLDKCRAKEVRTIQMGQGNKSSRILAWTFTPKRKFVKAKKENSRILKD